MHRPARDAGGPEGDVISDLSVESSQAGVPVCPYLVAVGVVDFGGVGVGTEDDGLVVWLIQSRRAWAWSTLTRPQLTPGGAWYEATCRWPIGEAISHLRRRRTPAGDRGHSGATAAGGPGSTCVVGTDHPVEPCRIDEFSKGGWVGLLKQEEVDAVAAHQATKPLGRRHPTEVDVESRNPHPAHPRTGHPRRRPRGPVECRSLVSAHPVASACNKSAQPCVPRWGRGAGYLAGQARR